MCHSFTVASVWALLKNNTPHVNRLQTDDWQSFLGIHPHSDEKFYLFIFFKTLVQSDSIKLLTVKNNFKDPAGCTWQRSIGMSLKYQPQV